MRYEFASDDAGEVSVHPHLALGLSSSFHVSADAEGDETLHVHLYASSLLETDATVYAHGVHVRHGDAVVYVDRVIAETIAQALIAEAFKR